MRPPVRSLPKASIIQDVAGDGYGNSDDAILASTTASISAITIKGSVVGPSDIYSFEARSIGSFKVGGVAVQLPTAPGTINPGPVIGGPPVKLFSEGPLQPLPGSLERSGQSAACY